MVGGVDVQSGPALLLPLSFLSLSMFCRLQGVMFYLLYMKRAWTIFASLAGFEPVLRHYDSYDLVPFLHLPYCITPAPAFLS